MILILTVAAAVLGYQAFARRYDHELHQCVTRHLMQLFPEASVYVGHVRQKTAGTIIATDVYLALKDTKPRQQIFRADRMEIEGDLGWGDVVAQSVAVRNVKINGAQVDIWRREDLSWSVESLAPRPREDIAPPTIQFQNATLRLKQRYADVGAVLKLEHIQGTIEPQTVAARKVRVGHETLIAKLSSKKSDLVERLDIAAQYCKADHTWRVGGNLTNLELAKGKLSRLQKTLSAGLSHLSGLECKVSAAFEVRSGATGPIFKVRGRLTDGRWQDARLPYPLENLESDFSVNNSQVQLRNMQAHSGKIRFELNSDIQGLALDSPMTVVAKAHHLDLDQRLYQALPPDLQEQWDKLQLSGRVSGSINLRYDGQKWSPSLSMMCEDVAVHPWLFPYPLTEIQGQVTYQNSHLSSQHLNGRVGGQDIVGSFSLKQNDRQWTGRLDCAVHGPVSIDEQLISALTPRDRPQSGAEAFVRQLASSGTIKLNNATFHRNHPEEAWHREIDANVFNGSIRYAGFKYPIYDIRGRIVGVDDDWALDRFEGRNDTGRIMCSGTWQSVSEGRPPLRLQFDALSVPIEEELKKALPRETQFVWNELRPAGSIDSVSVSIVRETPHEPARTVVRMIEDSASNSASGRSLRIRPKTFPYWLTDVDCEIDYSPGLVTIKHATGENGASKLALTGSCQPTSDGRWKASVDWLPQTRLIVESELLKALPQSIRESLVKIDFRGALSVLGSSEIVFANLAHPKLSTAWDCQVAVEDGQLGNGKSIGDLRGTMWMQGRSDGDSATATGSILMDALTVQGIPVTRLEGPFALIGSNLYFGAEVGDVLPSAREQASTNLTANALSGQMFVSGHGRLDSGKFYISASLRSADLSLLLKDLGVEGQTTQAACDADVDFQGIPWNPQTYDGKGRIRLSDAKLYQLPFMIRLMRVASVNANNDSAFQTADIRFEIDGDRIPLQIACDGEVLRLKGEGWTNLRKELELDLYSYVGRRIPIATVVSPLLAESRYATFMLIEVRGTLDNPSMQRRAFPQLEATFQQIFPELAESSKKDPLLPWQK